MPTELEKRISNFNYHHGANLSVDKLEQTLQKKLKYYDDILISKKDRNPELKRYLSGLTRTLSECIKEKIKIHRYENYDIASLDILSFIRDYEAIMKARQEEVEYDRVRAPYEGVDYNTLVQYVVNSTREYDQALSWNWAEDVLSGKLSIKDMKAVTDEAIADLDALGDDDEFGDLEVDKLANVYWAMKAMEMVRQQRGFFFKIFSFRINGREKEYFNQLVSAKDRFVSRGFPVAELQKVAYTSVMKEAYENVEKGLQRQEEQANDLLQEEKIEHINHPKMVDELQPRVQDSTLKAKVVEEITDKLPRCRWEKDLQKTMLASTIMDVLIRKAQEGNQAFDEEVAKRGNLQGAMRYHVQIVYQEAFLLTGSLGYMAYKHQIHAAQVITDAIMKNYSPVAFDEKAYGRFADGYMFADWEALEAILDLDTNEPYYDEARKEYNKMKSEKIQVSEVNERANAQVVAPVEPSLNVKEPIVVKK